MDLIISIGKGLLLGSSIAMLSFFLDISFSKKSFIKLCNESSEKYIQAVEAVQRNMMVISPLVYGVIDQSFIDHNSMTFQYNNIVLITSFIIQIVLALFMVIFIFNNILFYFKL